MLILTQDFNENDMFKSRAADPQDAIQARWAIKYIVSKMQFIILVMESTLIFPRKYFLFLSHQVYKAINPLRKQKFQKFLVGGKSFLL